MTMRQKVTSCATVTEDEVIHGILTNPHKSNQLVIRRHINNLTNNIHHQRAAKFMDLLPDGSVDKEAAVLLHELNDVKIPGAVDEGEYGLSYTVEWSGNQGIDEVVHRDYLASLCEGFYDSMTQLIHDCHARGKYSHADDTNNPLTEVLQHATMCKSRCDMFLGRGDILRSIQAYLLNSETSPDVRCPQQPLVVHGESGSGKTSILAMAAMMATDMGPTSPTVILRFLGQYANISAIRLVCQNR